MESVKLRRLANGDLLAGIMFVTVGLFAIAVTTSELPIGSAHNMGPGFVPLGLALLIVAFGVLVAVRGLIAPVDVITVPFEISASAYIFASLMAFGLLIENVGLVAAIPATVILSRIAYGDRKWPEIIMLAAALAALCWAVFVWALSVPIPVWV